MRLARPRTLAAQLALLVAAALFVAQAINFALLYGEWRERSLNAISAPAIARIHDAAERLQQGVGERRGPFGRRVRISAESAVDAGAPREPALEARIADGLGALGADIAEVHVTRAGEWRGNPRRQPPGPDGEPEPRQLYLVSAKAGPELWINVPTIAPREDDWLLGRLLVQTAVIYAVVLLAVLWLGRRAARSLDRLTDAAAGFGASVGGGRELHVEGPADVRRLTEAFNGMQRRIAAMLTEKDRMLGAIGHDLRTPLASLRLRAEGVEDPEERERMIATCEEMSATLHDILTLARVHQSAEAPTTVDLSALADAVADDFAELGADVVFEPSPRVIISLRPVLTRRAIRNLVENAVKYGGGARLRVAAGADAAVVEVDDDGPGLPESRLEEMFGDFARLEGSRSRATGGAGLGLAIAREIARGQGGDIVLQNRQGGGLTATLRLPAA
ncbi:sensor histidine kinase [Minwuia thermotolerans]|uniref:histidine kinase n=1 Tax=Minwuia thermotolerans TaxID=2056226 RepID=A0A2M9FVM9_9PROT|nr:ATP-binding protein [Minwuia thermotolerans]PJK27493.1 two-component sensor histidine kinase [Minwuia thermotolerans]